jgi:hypothetical protein
MQTLDGVERKLEADRPADLPPAARPSRSRASWAVRPRRSRRTPASWCSKSRVSCPPACAARRAARPAHRRLGALREDLSPTLVAQAAGHLVRLLQSIQPGARIAAPVTDAGTWKDPPARCACGRPACARCWAPISDEDHPLILTRLGFWRGTGAERWSVRSRRSARRRTSARAGPGRGSRTHPPLRQHRPSGRSRARCRPPRAIGAPQLVRASRIDSPGARTSTRRSATRSCPMRCSPSSGSLAQPHVAGGEPGGRGCFAPAPRGRPSLLAGLETTAASAPTCACSRSARVPARVPAMPRASLAEGARARAPSRAAKRRRRALRRQRALARSRASSRTSAALRPGERSFRAARGTKRRRTLGQPGPTALRLGEPGLLRPRSIPPSRAELGLSGELEERRRARVLSIDALLSRRVRACSTAPCRGSPAPRSTWRSPCPGTRPRRRGWRRSNGRQGTGGGHRAVRRLYQGPNLGAGRKSLAWHVCCRSETAPWTSRTARSSRARRARGPKLAASWAEELACAASPAVAYESQPRESRPGQPPEPARVPRQPRADGRLRHGGQPQPALPADRAGARRQRARAGGLSKSRSSTPTPVGPRRGRGQTAIVALRPDFVAARQLVHLARSRPRAGARPAQGRASRSRSSAPR